MSTKNTLEGGTYEIVQNRLQNHKKDLNNRLNILNSKRQEIFGSIESKLIANERLHTDNHCIARDIIAFGDFCLLGYNVHFGLRKDIKLSDVFSSYQYRDGHFHQSELSLISDDKFQEDFKNLYKYYRNTIFSKFAVIGNYLHLVFQLSESTSDIKTFKWLIDNNTLSYIDNRSENEFKYPPQQQIEWLKPSREMHRYGKHSHVSILDKVFVETIGGDLTIKIEDNTDNGKGIYCEDVEYPDQTLDDADYHYTEIENLILLKIKPYQQTERFFIYNHKTKEVYKIDSLKDAILLLPDQQGILFSNGFYLQTGEFKQFNNTVQDVKYLRQIKAQNGEDFIYVFYEETKGDYLIISYNLIEQKIKTPIICNGFTILENGELAYFKSENDATNHHLIQIWQTPFTKKINNNTEHKEKLLFQIGNKEIVRAMAECRALITLLNKQDNYDDLYEDVRKKTVDIIDAYYWMDQKDAQELHLPILQIQKTSESAIDEFEKVKNLQKLAAKKSLEVKEYMDDLFQKIKHTKFNNIDDFVQLLSNLRNLRGQFVGLKELKYADLKNIEKQEELIKIQNDKIALSCVDFLLDDKALAPYQERIQIQNKQIEKLTKVIEAKNLNLEINQISKDLELLIEIIHNLNIEDTSHSTEIIDRISLLFSQLNQSKANLKRKTKNIGITEAKADFYAQIKLFDQSTINYLELTDTKDKCDEYLTKLSVYLEELEGKFIDYPEFLKDIITKREDIYTAFDTRKNMLNEALNKKTIALESAANRILNSIQKKANTLKSSAEINTYFATDIMVNKLRDIITKLDDLEDSGKSESIQTSLKSAKEESLRKLKDKLDLYEDGGNIIQLGTHKFGVNKQELDLSIIEKNKELFFHLTATDFYQKIEDKELLDTKEIWNQSLISENEKVYRAEFLAYKIYCDQDLNKLQKIALEDRLKFVQSISSQSFQEGYIKGVHDLDATQILNTLIEVEDNLKLLKYKPKIRAIAQIFWCFTEEKFKKEALYYLNSAKEILTIFPDSNEFDLLINRFKNKIEDFLSLHETIQKVDSLSVATYLFNELSTNTTFSLSKEAFDIKLKFIAYLKDKNAWDKFTANLKNAQNTELKINLLFQWVKSYINKQEEAYLEEVISLLLIDQKYLSEINPYSSKQEIKSLNGEHSLIKNGNYSFDYHHFISKLKNYRQSVLPLFKKDRKLRSKYIKSEKENLKLEEFKPKVLSSFVRNKLIDQVYLPIIGDNLAKQLGTLGANKRSDRMGMLLLISPPGYGKTTLMEYISNRLGLIFMKINGPAIGHDITSVDPLSAKNATAREELKKLNLAFEMGNNVMLYLDDIQHCNPEFLQKFISLSDGQRKIEGVYNGKPKTYDLRGKKFCVVMAGNPYTESGDKFQIPDMLSNRADIYNLGDVIGDSADLFNLSLIENSLTSNATLQKIIRTEYNDIYPIIEAIENNNLQSLDLKSNHTKQDIEEYIAVLTKVIHLRNVLVKVNNMYIKSAAMAEEYRKEPPFKLQGSYRDMNKMIAKINPIMNHQELELLILSHYESEAQTLSSATEDNLLKFKELTGIISPEETKRWNEIKVIFNKNKTLKGIGKSNEMAQVISQLMKFTEGLDGIQEVLKKGL